MNLVVDDAVEVRLATKTEEEKRRKIGLSYPFLFSYPAQQLMDLFFFTGQILLKGDNVSLIQAVQ